MGVAEDVATEALRGTVEVLDGWPGSDHWAALTVWRQDSVGAVLVGRRVSEGEVRFDVLVGTRDGDDWEIAGGGGSSVNPFPGFSEKTDKVDWFFYQDVFFSQEDDEGAYVTNLVGVAAPGVEQLTLVFADGARVEVDITSEDRLVLVGVVRTDAEEDLSFRVS
ncbi:MAG TPA: hypothetical protein VMT27_05345 [Actinomycetes bacterium]|nr:hypothetical protein [Actinomycetes bacterium]